MKAIVALLLLLTGHAQAWVVEVPIPPAGTSGRAWVAYERTSSSAIAASCYWRVGAVRVAPEPTCSAGLDWTAAMKRETLAAAGTADPVRALDVVVAKYRAGNASDQQYAPAYSVARAAALANRPADPVWTVRKYGTGTRTAATPIAIERAADGVDDAYMIAGTATVPALAQCDCKRIMFPGGVCLVPGQPVAVVAQCVRR